jgi:hypothetical protein
VAQVGHDGWFQIEPADQLVPAGRDDAAAYDCARKCGAVQRQVRDAIAGPDTAGRKSLMSLLRVEQVHRHGHT